MTVKLRLLVVLIALCSSFATAKENPPPGGEPRPYTLPPATTRTFDNGLKLTLLQFGNIPKVTVAADVRVGNLNEGEHIWLADLLGRMLTQGAGKRDTSALASAAANMGGEINVSVGIARSDIGVDVLSEFGPDAVALLADVVRRPQLPDGPFEAVQANMLKNIAIAQSSPQSQAEQAFRRTLYGDHPYGVGLPDPEQFKQLSIADVRRFHAAQFGAARTHIYVAGRFDEKAMIAAVRRGFADWPRGPAPMAVPEVTTNNGKLYLVDRPGAVQSTVYLGIPVVGPGADDYLPLTLLNTLLGGSFSSRITRNIRETRGYTYSPRGSIVARPHSAYWLENADISSPVTGPAISEIFNEIRRLTTQAPDDDELTRFKNYATGTFVLRSATRGGLIGQLKFLDTYGLDRSYLTQYVANLHAVRPEQIRELSEKYLKIKGMTLVVVGDLTTVLPQLKALPALDVSSAITDAAKSL